MLYARNDKLCGQVAVTHDPNRKEDRPVLKRGEYIAGGSVVGTPAWSDIVSWFMVTVRTSSCTGRCPGHDVPDNAQMTQEHLRLGVSR